MEVILGIGILLFALFFVIHSTTELVKQLKSGNPARLGNGFTATISVQPMNNENEVSKDDTNFKKTDDE